MTVSTYAELKTAIGNYAARGDLTDRADRTFGAAGRRVRSLGAVRLARQELDRAHLAATAPT